MSHVGDQHCDETTQTAYVTLVKGLENYTEVAEWSGAEIMSIGNLIGQSRAACVMTA